ncbi:MAG: ATP-binding protein [Verrucomicrobia bacterium]|nr:ATP-binding protein [Verrucomicrobiota bacterium]
MPAAGAFVGADVTAGAVATGLLDEHRVTLLIDFGTNGEMVLSSPNAVLATATAAGPAFEGGRLSCGTTARPGAISSLDLNASLGWHCHRQGACAARDFVGITGSAYVDFLALTSQCELLSALGRFNRQHPLWCKSGRMVNGLAALFVDENHFVSEADIAELLQAKAAIGSGIAMLLRRARLNVSDIEQLLIAGGFGYYLNPSHAAYIGLLPNLPLQRIRIPGNAALAGASIALQYNLTLPIQQWLSRVQCIELNSEPEFANLFSDCLALEPL